MVDEHSPRRGQVARYVAVAAAVLGVVTLVAPDWIEVLTRYDPDNHSGAVETIGVVALFVVAVVTGGYALGGAKNSRAMPSGSRKETPDP